MIPFLEKWKVRLQFHGFDGRFLDMAAPSPEKVIQIAAELLKAKAAVASLQEQWDSLFLDQRESRAGRKRDPSGPTSRILAHMEQHPQVPFSSQVLADVLSIEKDRVESALYNLYVAGKIKRPDRGLYQANPNEELQPV